MDEQAKIKTVLPSVFSHPSVRLAVFRSHIHISHSAPLINYLYYELPKLDRKTLVLPEPKQKPNIHFLTEPEHNVSKPWINAIISRGNRLNYNNY